MMKLHNILIKAIEGDFHLEDVKNFYKNPDKDKRLCYYHITNGNLISVVALWGDTQELKDFFNEDKDTTLLCIVNSDGHIEYINKEAVEI